MSDDGALLRVENINTYYGHSHVLKDLSLEVRRGETLALLGRNGVGKTTTLKSIVRWVPPRSGSIVFDGQSLDKMDIMHVARLGISLVPEERRIFPNLSVYENLRLAQVTARRPGWPLDRVFAHFPRLAERLRNKGDAISGGEKQMLAIARALVQDTRLLLLDEPTEGLAPLIVRELEDIILEIKRSGMTTLLVEQNMYTALAVADRCCVLDSRGVQFTGTPEQLRASPDVLHRYLHI